MGIVYLLQPYQYSKRNIYKIGMSRKNNLDRPSNYGINSTIYLIMNCEDSLLAESKIRKVFKKKFKNCIGYDYFKGDIYQMKQEFTKIVFYLNKRFMKKKMKEEVKQDGSNKQPSTSESHQKKKSKSTVKKSDSSTRKRKRCDSDDEDEDYVYESEEDDEDDDDYVDEQKEDEEEVEYVDLTNNDDYQYVGHNLSFIRSLAEKYRT